MMKKSDILNELLERQNKNIPSNVKLGFNDMKRITKYIDTSIFSNNCCIWNGYITNKGTTKPIYINFFFRDKKMALHRLLYKNYIGDLKDDEYLKYSCENKGTCCSLSHMIKYKYKENEIQTSNVKFDLKHADSVDSLEITLNF